MLVEGKVHLHTVICFSSSSSSLHVTYFPGTEQETCIFRGQSAVSVLSSRQYPRACWKARTGLSGRILNPKLVGGEWEEQPLGQVNPTSFCYNRSFPLTSLPPLCAAPIPRTLSVSWKLHHKYSMYEIINHDSGPQGLIIFYSDTLFLLFQENLVV